MKFTLGIRVSSEQELRGSDEVEHNIIEYVKTIETKHVLGKRVTKLKNSKKPDQVIVEGRAADHMTSLE
jgi:Ammonia permease